MINIIYGICKHLTWPIPHIVYEMPHRARVYRKMHQSAASQIRSRCFLTVCVCVCVTHLYRYVPSLVSSLLLLLLLQLVYISMFMLDS